MRKLVGFLCFVFSLIVILVIVYVNIDVLIPLVEDQNLFSVGAIAIILEMLSNHLYPALMILLLSVIAMGDYKRS